MLIQIKNLRLRTIIGINEWEREKPQDIIVNIKIEYDGTRAAQSDQLEHSVNYKEITKQMIQEVENSKFLLLEKLSEHLLQKIMKDPMVYRATVEIDKPHALRFADSVSVTNSAERKK